MELTYQRVEWAAHAESTRHLRVLVVSDDAASASRIALAVRLARHHADTADLEAFNIGIAHDFSPDVMILNLRALKTQGRELAKLIREYVICRRLRDVVLVAVTDIDRDKVSSKIEYLVGSHDMLGLQQLLYFLAS